MLTNSQPILRVCSVAEQVTLANYSTLFCASRRGATSDGGQCGLERSHVYVRVWIPVYEYTEKAIANTLV